MPLEVTADFGGGGGGLGETPSRHHDRLLSQIRKDGTYLVISKLQPFRRSRALFRMMPLSLPGYTFLSEFIGARWAGRPEETAISLFRWGKKKKKQTSGGWIGERKSLFERKGEILQLSAVHLSGADKVILQTFFFFFFFKSLLDLYQWRCAGAVRGAWWRAWRCLHVGWQEQICAWADRPRCRPPEKVLWSQTEARRFICRGSLILSGRTTMT